MGKYSIMENANLKAKNRKWLFGLVLFLIGLSIPFIFRGFFLKNTPTALAVSTGVNYPEDFKQRFQKAAALADQNKTQAAIDAYESLLSAYPNYPEPYNNLAVLLAQSGRLEEARQKLEIGMQTNPAYATVYNNLGNVYERLASDSYKKALNIDKSLDNQNIAALTPISSVGDSANTLLAANELTAPPSRANSDVTNSESPSTAIVIDGSNTTTTITTPAPDSMDSSQTEEKESNLAMTESESEPLPPPAVLTYNDESSPSVPNESASEVSITPAEPVALPNNDDEDKTAVINRVNNWAHAWSQKDVKGYVASYAPNYAPKGQTHDQWENTRKQRILEKNKIDVKVKNVQVELMGNDRAKARFTQHYEAGKLKTSTRKTMILKKTDSNAWRIEEEHIG